MFIGSKKIIDETFGVKRTREALEGMSIRYSALGGGGATEQIYRDENGQYYLSAAPKEDGHRASLGWFGGYNIDEQIIMPISRQSARHWANIALWGNELETALKEFGEKLEDFKFLGEFGAIAATAPADMHEWLGKYDAENFVMFSTDDSYPFCSGSTTLCFNGANGATIFVDDVYFYFIPAATARRWAELNGADASTCAAVFGLS